VKISEIYKQSNIENSFCAPIYQPLIISIIKKTLNIFLDKYTYMLYDTNYALVTFETTDPSQCPSYDIAVTFSHCATHCLNLQSFLVIRLLKKQLQALP